MSDMPIGDVPEAGGEPNSSPPMTPLGTPRTRSISNVARYRALGGAAITLALIGGLALASSHGAGPQSSRSSGSGIVIASDSESAAPSQSDLASVALFSPAAPSSSVLPSPSATAAHTPSAAARTTRPTATPKVVKGGWKAGKVWIYGDIVQTAKGFLAACAFTEDAYFSSGEALCSSSDLINWTSPPDSTVFVNGAADDFLPEYSIPVNSGFAVAGSKTNDPGDIEWYSADGIHWNEGIPDDQRLPNPPDPCVAWSAISGDCAAADYLLASADSKTIVAVYSYGPDSDNYVWERLAVSTDGGATWQKPSLPKDLWQVYTAPQRMADGTWFAIFTVMPPAPPPGAVYGGSPSAILVTSKDAIHWQVQADSSSIVFAASLGSSIYGSFGDYESGGGDIEVSTDGGKSWIPVTDAAGDEITGEYILSVGGKIVVCDGVNSDPAAITWVGP